MQKQSEKWLVFNLTKFYLLGVKDPSFITPMLKLLESNATACANNSDRYIMLYNWLELGKNEVHREALKRKLYVLF
jgi:hypothetical protein